jgi:hypothetical protein
MSSASFAQEDHFSRPDEGPIGADGGWFLAACILFIVAAAAAYAGRPYTPAEFRTPIIATVIACALPLALLIGRSLQVLNKIGRAELTTPFESVARGVPVTAVYKRPMRGNAALEAVEANLQLEERVTRKSGKNRKTFTSIVLNESLAPVVRSTPDQLRIDIPIRIPDAGPPTINVDDVEVRWFVRMRLRMRGCPGTRSSFELNVAPGVVKR